VTLTGSIYKSVVQRIEADEFGRVIRDTNPGFQPFGFGGGLYDAATGLVRFGAREYHSRVGRWMERDPILFVSGQTNLYSYIDGDPINGSDPFGLFSSPDPGGGDRSPEPCDLAAGNCFNDCMDNQKADWALAALGVSLPAVSVPKVGRAARIAAASGGSAFTTPLSMAQSRGVLGKGARALGRR
jgi:RHS repeat-associated protein